MSRERNAMTNLGRKLTRMYEAMRRHFGPQHWWPVSRADRGADAKLEICVGAILTQNTSWKNVEKAIANLHETDLMSVSALHGVRQDLLAGRIRSAGYFNVKARRLKSFIARVHRKCGGDIERFLSGPVSALRQELLSINGIGPETADSIVLYAAGKATFVVDAYTRRILLRHGLIAPGDDYDAVKALFESHLPACADLWNDYHAQLVCVGKTYCRPAARCPGCPLARFRHDGGAER